MNHTPSVSVRNIVLGEGIPKICIPLVSTCLDALLNDMKKALDHSADLIEWRVDWMDDILKKGYLEEILPAVRKAARGYSSSFYLPHQKGRRKYGCQPFTV